jgi:hypothetical protein
VIAVGDDVPNKVVANNAAQAIIMVIMTGRKVVIRATTAVMATGAVLTTINIPANMPPAQGANNT